MMPQSPLESVRRAMARLACIALAAGALASCVPMVSAYYRPDSVEGSLVHENCADQLAPRNTWKFLFGPADLRITVEENRLFLAVHLHNGNVTVFDAVTLSVRDGPSSMEFPLGDFSVDDGTNGPVRHVTGPLVGALNPHSDGQGATIFQTTVDMGPTRRDAFVLQLPNVVVDGVRYPVPAITFTRHTGFGIYAVNC